MIKIPETFFGKAVDAQKAYQNLVELAESIERDKEAKEQEYLLERLRALTGGKKIVLEYEYNEKARL